MMDKIVDSHAHLEEITDLAAALNRARQAGVVAIIAVGADLKSNQEVLNLSGSYQDSRAYPVIFPALGIHPGNLHPAEFSSTFKLIEENIDRIVAIGEIGLDYWYKQARRDASGRRLQQEIFLKQLDIAKQQNKPVIIHSRGAWEDCLAMVAQEGIQKAVFHWYSGPEDVLEGILQKGYFVSASPSAEYSKEHRQVIKRTPLENMLIETDAPVVFKPESGKYESEPKDVLRSLKAVAQLKDIKEALVAEKTFENARELFGLKLVY